MTKEINRLYFALIYGVQSIIDEKDFITKLSVIFVMHSCDSFYAIWMAVAHLENLTDTGRSAIHVRLRFGGSYDYKT